MEESDLEQFELDFNILKTRAAEHERACASSSASEQSVEKTKRSARYAHTIKCEQHYDKNNDAWSHENNACHLCTRFVILETNGIKESVLPRVVDVLNLVLTWKSECSGKHTNIFWECAKIVSSTWLECNVYPESLHAVERKINHLFNTYRTLNKYSTKSKTYWSKCTPFLESMNELFDIAAIDDTQKQWEKKCHVKNDSQFYENQKKNPPIGYSTKKVDKVWEKSEKRREKRNNPVRNQYHDFTAVKVPLNEIEVTDNTTEDPEFEEPVLKKKYDYVVAPENTNDDMPYRYRHLRSGLRSVRPEVYSLILKFKSKYHMSQHQAEAAVIETGNYLFGRNWQFYDPEKPTDDNTLPAASNTRRVEPYLEAMALSTIVEEVMNGSKAVMYANDGSAMSGVGNYVVQSITIDGVQRALPTLSIFTETRESLEELEVMTLRILVASSGYKYTEKQLLERIDFVMTDSTSHNLTVMESVCDRFEAESPKALLCNVHPLMMFQRKVKDVFQLLHDTLGKDRILDCFLVDVDFANEDFITKAIKCLTSFINKDNSAKPWNRQKHFDSFIAPKSNESLSYKDHRFNRLFQCCLVLVHHIDDISSYLDTYRNVVNGISILDRSFVEMSLLKPVFCAAALIGIHITIPFQALLSSNETNYSTLLAAFPVLYDELNTVDPEDLCSTKVQAFHFISPDIFKSVLKRLKDVVLESLASNILIYKVEVTNLLRLMLPRLAEGFSTQRGKIFGFGPEAESPTVTFKVSAATDEELQKLNLTAVHNLGEERSVGSINYELGIRGKGNLETSSKKLLLSKSFDLLEKSGKLSEYKSFRKASQDIQLMKIEWNNKMKRMEEEGNLKKDEDNNHIEGVKYKDLEYLKERNGPFTTVDEVNEFDAITPEGPEKIKRLYTEVRFAKNSCISLKHTASVFRLQRDHKKLPSKEYVENLCQYLGDARNKTVLTAEDLSVVLTNLITSNDEAGKTTNVVEGTQQQSIDGSNQSNLQNDYNLDEHIAAVWIDEKENVLSWFLGVVNSISSDSINVTYYHRKDKDGTSWTIPDDDSDPVATPRSHIIFREITVGYMQTRVIRCSIDKRTVKEIGNAFEKYINELD